MTLTLGKKMCREGLNVCMKYEFNLLHHVGVVAKGVCAAAETAAHRGDDNTPSGPTGQGVKTTTVALSRLRVNLQKPEFIHSCSERRLHESHLGQHRINQVIPSQAFLWSSQQEEQVNIVITQSFKLGSNKSNHAVSKLCYRMKSARKQHQQRRSDNKRQS